MQIIMFEFCDFDGIRMNGTWRSAQVLECTTPVHAEGAIEVRLTEGNLHQETEAVIFHYK